jgi:hypothetical protein
MKNATRKRNKYDDLRSHLASRGMKFGLGFKAYHREFEKVLGPDRYEEYQKTFERVKAGRGEIWELYRFARTPEEASIIFSSQAESIFRNAAWIDGKIAEAVRPGSRVGEMGCAGGALTAWLARENPECSFVGIDRVETFVEWARDSVALPNARFEVWDYGCPKPDSIGSFDILISSFGIDPPRIRERETLGVDQLREGDSYRRYKEFFVPILAGWRGAVRDGGKLFAVFRLGCLTTFMAYADAGSESGWTLSPAASEWLTVGGERFPALVMTAVRSDPLSEDDLAAFYADEEITRVLPNFYFDTMAVVLYRALDGKEIIDSGEETYDNGHTMRTVVGRARSLGFRFSRATTGVARLQIVPATRLHELEVTSDWPC